MQKNISQRFPARQPLCDLQSQRNVIRSFSAFCSLYPGPETGVKSNNGNKRVHSKYCFTSLHSV